jgi:hypothetical protein
MIFLRHFSIAHFMGALRTIRAQKVAASKRQLEE